MPALSPDELVRDLRARRIVVDGGNGNVYDVPDEVCEQAADRIEQQPTLLARRGYGTMTTLEKLVQALRKAAGSGADGDSAARVAVEALRTPGVENTDRIFNVMLDRILREEV